MWELRLIRDGWSVEVREARGQELPDWYLEEPEIRDNDDFYLNAFNDLSTTRQIGMSVGPIPWDRVLQYAAWSGLDDENTEYFVGVIREMDSAWMEWSAEEMKKKSRVSESEDG